MQQEIYTENLIHKNEKKYFALVLTISIIAYLALLISIIGIFIIVGLFLISMFFHAIMMGHIRSNAVKLSEQQFPEIYQKTRGLSAKMELPYTPDIYVAESGGTLNAFATRFFGRNMVILYSEIFELHKKGGEEELTFVIAHELAHIKRRHLSKMMFILPAMWLPVVGELYLRACEYTCDRYAAHYVGNTEAAKNGLMILAVGKELYRDVNRLAYVDQLEAERGFFVWLSEILSTHPPLPKRIREIGIYFQDEEFISYINKSSNKVWLWVTAGLISFVLLSAGGIYGIGKLVSFVETMETSDLLEDDIVYDEGEEVKTPDIINAVANNDMDEIIKLVEEGRDIEAQDANGNTALNWAVLDGNGTIAYYLLKAGADPNQELYYGTTPVMTAAERANTEMLTILLNADGDPNVADTDGWTSLYYGVQGGSVEVVQLLLQTGANPQVTDTDDMTPLMYAIQYGMHDISDILKRQNK
ncbi:M48 family metallopeptidase [Bacillus sp. FSL K6-3431]|uniref:M48 family metallopeptidase n=1 Tax=Bacillus sp. FSL K6-3431 TaxID=2921500 RepID=UPI0030F73176